MAYFTGSNAMNITLNGQPQELSPDTTVAGLVEQMGITGRLAVEVNEEIVPRSGYDARRLREGDRVEIVHAIGGGQSPVAGSLPPSGHDPILTTRCHR